MADEGDGRMDDQQAPANGRNAGRDQGLAQRAARMLRDMPAGPRDEGQVELGPLDRDFHVLVQNANAVLAEQLAVLGQVRNHDVGGAAPAVGEVERVAVGLIDELRNMIEQLAQQRDEMRQLVMQRGLLDPHYGQWDDLLDVWGVRNAHAENHRKRMSPESLENSIVDYLAGIINGIPVEVNSLPTALLFQLYVSLFKKDKLHILRSEWSNIDRFLRILSWKMKRMMVHRLFNGLLHRGYLTEQALFEELKRRIQDRGTVKDMALYECTLNLGTFLLDHGSFTYPSEIFGYCQKILKTVSTDYQWRQRKLFELNYWLLKYYMSNCSFVEATNISSFTDTLIDKLGSSNANATADFAQIQAQSACLWYMLGDYNNSLKFCLKALDAAKNKETQVATQVELLCITAKILVFKRHFTLALRTVRFAVALVLSHRDLERLLCSVLCDYGDCLLNSDLVEMAVKVYTVMAKIVNKHFGTASLRDGQAMYEYARAAYTLLYDNYAQYRGNRERYVQVRFRCEKYAEKAVEICRAKLDKEHYQLINAEQLQALIQVKSTLRSEVIQQRILNDAARVHMQALSKFLSLGSEGANCARTYDYLGKIFRLTQRPELSEEMFEKALETKRNVYGRNDHEVALTMASLGYLYVEDMRRPREALVLFKKCLEIELNTFGEEYSGLGYIYDGMTSAYEAVDDLAEARSCRERIHEWKTTRSLLEAAPAQNPFGNSLYVRDTFQEILAECFTTLLPYYNLSQSSDVEMTELLCTDV